ncbi:MAG TPA: hypothetical protein VMR74_04020 [Gammaproteobacteria bacterium]|nr:hypothetical protein [Gammaproteobacteria bacterium]
MRALRNAAVLFALAASAFLALRLGTTQNVSEESTDDDNASCHDLMQLFSGGATRISARFWTELAGSGDDDWPELVKMLEQFARARDWSIYPLTGTSNESSLALD